MKVQPLRWGRRIAPLRDGESRARCTGTDCGHWLFEICDGKPGRTRANVKLLRVLEPYNFEALRDGTRPVDPKHRLYVFQCTCGEIWNFEEQLR